VSKISAFLTYVLPIFLFLGVIQVLLLTVSLEKRRKINFAILSLLAIASIRPNILGETFGIIGPLYFFLLVKISNKLRPDFEPEEKSILKLRNLLFTMFTVTFLYWIYVLAVSSFRTYPVSAWPPIANLGTIGLDGYFILQLFKNGTSIRFMRMFIYIVTFESVTALISKYVFDYNFCTNISAGRGWNYSLCFPGAIFSSGVRLTGFGGEPAIFATYLAVTVLFVTWVQFDFSLVQKILIVIACAIASLNSGSTTGTTLIFVSLALIPFQKLSFRGSPFVLTMYSAIIYYLFSTKLLQGLSEKIIQNKLQQNAGSITGRNLDLGFQGYLKAWGRFPFGSQWNGNVLAANRGINLLADSLSYGPMVIFLMFLLIVTVVSASSRYTQTLSIGTIFFISVLLVEPAWANAIWFALLFAVTCVNLAKVENLHSK
jgi:hypothetical protein